LEKEGDLIKEDEGPSKIRSKKNQTGSVMGTKTSFMGGKGKKSKWEGATIPGKREGLVKVCCQGKKKKTGIG